MPATHPLPAPDAAASAPDQPAMERAPDGTCTATDAPAAGATAATPATSPTDCGLLLRQLWPALFTGAAKPIKLRIQKDIQARKPGGFTRAALSAFLHRHTGSTSYLLAISKGGPRFDLDGKADGEISDEHRKVAAEELARRRANRAAREELELQQRRNRAGLLHDFERTTLTRANFCALKGVAEDALEGLLAIARDEAAQMPAPPRDRPPHRQPRR